MQEALGKVLRKGRTRKEEEGRREWMAAWREGIAAGGAASGEEGGRRRA